MKYDPDKLPIGGHAFQNLTPEEERELYRAALDDQAVFDELMEEEGLRQFLEKPGVRRELLAALQPAPSLWDRLFAFLQRPAGMALAGGLAAAAFLIGFFATGPGATDKIDVTGPTLAQRPTAVDVAVLGARIFALPVAGVEKALTGGPALELAQTSYRIGDPFRFTVRAAAGSRVYVLEQWPDGTFVQRLPNALQQDNEIPAGGEVTVPAAGLGGENLAGPTGERKIRLAVFPAGVSPEGLSDENARRVTIVEKMYNVEQ